MPYTRRIEVVEVNSSGITVAKWSKRFYSIFAAETWILRQPRLTTKMHSLKVVTTFGWKSNSHTKQPPSTKPSQEDPKEPEALP